MKQADATKGTPPGSPLEVDHAAPRQRRGGIMGALDWYLAWALPGMGMLSEAYIIFSAGQIKDLQQALYPTCFNSKAANITDCDSEMILHVAGYIQICGIMAGMLLWGFLGDITGRKWGSRCVAMIMLSGCILLTFSPWAPTPYGYFVYFMVAQTWYGFGVGGEYPMASASAAERASTTPELRAYRGRQVVLVFSGQGMGNFVNGIVIVVSMAIFGQTGASSTLTHSGARSTLALMYGVGAVLCLAMVLYRLIFLHESKMFVEAVAIETAITKTEHTQHYAVLRRHILTWRTYWARQLVASVAWICNDFAFYGNKLQQGVFLGLLFPTATPYKKLQWSVLNSFIALLGYYTAAWLVDKPWYGRRLMQNVGFIAMFVFYIIIYGQWNNMGVAGAPEEGVKAFQAMYYLSSFFNQFGPNATTWLVAAPMEAAAAAAAAGGAHSGGEELDLFMTHYVLLLCSFKEQLQQHVRVHAMEAVMACWELEQTLQSLTGASPGEGTGATMSDDEDNQVDSESNFFDGNDGSDGMGFGPLMLTEGERSLVERVRQELKHELKQGYREKLVDIREEIMRKRRAGKLPGDTASTLKAWWQAHSKWPYPTEEDKARLVQETGLQLKQINNWFINQRKRNWHNNTASSSSDKSKRKRSTAGDGNAEQSW